VDRADIEARFRAYIDNINAAQFDAAVGFYHETFDYDDQPFSRAQLRDLFAAVQAMVPDSHVEIRQLIIDGDHLSVRLRRTGTAVMPFFGIPTNGQPAALAEHTVYRFRDGRVDAVWAVIDLAPLLAAAA
jgi:steroid delta-isomerase-like uncharacterized protein